MKLPINAPSPVRRRPARDRGFSLIEMLVVVIIITLLAALIAVVIIVGVTLIGTNLQAIFNYIGGKLKVPGT